MLGVTMLDNRIPTVLERVDLAGEVARRIGPPAKDSGGVQTFRCPHPDHEDRNPSFTVKAGRGHCWSRCGWSGDVIDLVCWLDGITKADAIDVLAERVGLRRERIDPTRIADRGLLDQFARSRRWDLAVLDDLSVHVVDTGRGQRRVRFPFVRAGVVVYHQDRALGLVTPKWLSARGEIPCPYNADAIARAKTAGAAFIVEGVADTVALLHEWPDAAVIGCPGSGVFKERWAAAFRGLQVFVIGDNDPAGATFRDRVVRYLAPVGAVVWHVYVPNEFHDVDDWRKDDPDAFEERFLAELDRLDAVAVAAA